MVEKFIDFMSRHDSFILTTHDPADADGIGTQMVLACILRKHGKKWRIINASPIPQQFKFMDPLEIIEEWSNANHGSLPQQSAMIIVDTADETTIGHMKDAYFRSREIFVVDHHEEKPDAPTCGICDSTCASASELSVQMAMEAGVALDAQAAFAAYSGIVHDTGFFAFPKTKPQTFRIAVSLLEMGVNPNEVYNQLCQNTTTEAVLLQKKAIASMTLHCSGRVAVQALRLQDFAETGAMHEDTDGFANFPLRSGEIVVSLFAKESPDHKVRCSLRSKGAVNVAKIAQEFGGGGHVNAAGFKSDLDINRTLSDAIARIAAHLEDY